jgi:hypothetical protein
MLKRFAAFSIVPFLTGGCLFADFSYEQTSKMTGGMMMGMVKVMGTFSKQMREPMKATVLIKGDRMVHLQLDQAQIFDLSKETITHINFQKKTYSVITFQQMNDFLKQMDGKVRDEKGNEQMEIAIKPSVKQTGQTKQFAGLDASETLLRIEMEGTDKKSGQKGVFMVVDTDMWLAKNVAGFAEVRNFQRRMAEKLAFAPGGNMFTQGRSDMAKGMAELYKQSAALEGMPVFMITKMGMGGAQPGQTGEGGAAAPAEQQPAQQQQQPQAEPEKQSVGSALGKLGRFGGIGGFGRKKKQDDQQAQAQPASADSAPPAQGQPQGAPGSLMELTTELTNFSAAPVDASKFEIPAGFKQVEDDMTKSMRR